MAWLIEPNVCPGLFYGTSAQDGFLIRIRTPGGLLNHQQGRAIATLAEQTLAEQTLAEQWGSHGIQVTNRANVQIRSVQTSPTVEALETLQTLGLAAHNPRIDHLRNVMTSPTAGIDVQELIDTRPLVRALDEAIQSHSELADLSAKFSIGIDGGGTVGIGTRSSIPWEHRYNEIQLSAVVGDGKEGLGAWSVGHGECLAIPDTQAKPICFRLSLGGDKQLWETQVLVAPDDCVAVVAALAKVYLEYVQQSPRLPKKPRMKHLLQDWGVERYLQQVNHYLPHPLQPAIAAPSLSPTQPYAHLGIHPQRQSGLSYIGIPLRLGQLTATQLRGVVDLSETFGSCQLRLTPWQTMVLPDIPDAQVAEVVRALSALGLVISENQVATAIVACAGKPGCAAAETQTQAHAIALANHLNQNLVLESPVNIHLTGCPKSCAQPSPADILLMGTGLPTQDDGNQPGAEIVEGYQLYINGVNSHGGGSAQDPLEQKATQYHLCDVTASELPSTIEQLMKLYKQHRATPHESFGEFVSKFSRTSLIDNFSREDRNANHQEIKH
ncbi:precorrin-3B synthase [Alkalinema sp. FACHB-956]|uniref:precorrin-3B synthase n=1 Tax=Alkalinema sp. FACHB-956 TaxID=2692768 RepID=UPI0016870D39|nr:precorrin-3B synthase [Alkalinema sp. FACHB-956]MBD2328010.1 precorrin-3B synthase [Alkalinema sp. FACHB-956]